MSEPEQPKAPELVRFFRDEEAEWGHKGDYENWSPERSAIELIRSLRAALRASGAGTRQDLGRSVDATGLGCAPLTQAIEAARRGYMGPAKDLLEKYAAGGQPPSDGTPSVLSEEGVEAAYRAFCRDWPYELSPRVRPSLFAALQAYLAAERGVSAVPPTQEGEQALPEGAEQTYQPPQPVEDTP